MDASILEETTNRFGGAEKEFQLADISPSIVFLPEDEYIYVNYLMRPNTSERDKSEIIPEELKLFTV